MNTSDVPLRVLCVDDHPIVRQGLAMMLGSAPDMTLVGAFATGQEAIEGYTGCQPHVTLMDLRLPDRSGIEVIAAIRAAHPAACILVLTSEQGDAQVKRAMEAGACGFLLKDIAARELLQEIRRAAGTAPAEEDEGTNAAPSVPRRFLTARELEVVARVAAGLRNKQIAAELAISEETVKIHLRNIMDKLGANDRAHAVSIAIRRGFIPP